MTTSNPYISRVQGDTVKGVIWGENDIFAYTLAVPDSDGVNISWQIKGDFTEPEPYKFHVYRSYNGGDSDDWEKIAEYLEDVNSYVDTDYVENGKRNNVVYKVELLSTIATHESPIIPYMAGLTTRQQGIAKHISRNLNLLSVTLPQPQGYLLKRKLFGTECPDCVDTHTKEVTNSDCSTCYGTGKVHGYWKSLIPKKIIVSSPLDSTPIFDTSLNLGTVAPAETKVKFPGLIPISPYDVWVYPHSSKRFYIVQVQVSADIAGLPIVYDATMRQAELSDIIYQYNI